MQFLLNMYALTTLNAIAIGFGRVLIGFLTLLTLFPFFLKEDMEMQEKMGPPKITWYHYALIGFFEAAPCIVIPLGQMETSSSIAAILLGTMPIFAILFAALTRLPNEQLTLSKALSIIVGFIGVVFIVHPTSMTNMWGEIGPEILILLSSASWGFSLTLIRRFPDVHPVRFTRNLLFWGVLEMGVVWLIFGYPEQLRFTPASFWSMILLGTVNAGLVYILFVLLIRQAGVAFASFANYFVPIVGMLLGVYVLHEKIHWLTLLGVLIIFAGLGINSVRLHKKQS